MSEKTYKVYSIVDGREVTMTSICVNGREFDMQTVARTLDSAQPTHGFNEPEPHAPQYPPGAAGPAPVDDIPPALNAALIAFHKSDDLSYRLGNRPKKRSTYMDNVSNGEKTEALGARLLDAHSFMGDPLLKEAATALEAAMARIAEAEERAHYAEGTAELAMKHRDEAEAQASRLRNEMERIADLTEKWTDSLVSQVNEIARGAIAAFSTKWEDGR